MSDNIEDWLYKTKKHQATFGVELEMMLFDINEKRLVRDGDFTHAVLSTLPHEISKDYYPFQLEIRTNPHSEVEDILKETRKFYKMAKDAFAKEGVLVIPAPELGDESRTPCGMHVHVHYPGIKDNNLYWNRAMGMYPFILALSDHSKNSERNIYDNSHRMNTSPHIGLPYLNQDEFIGMHGGTSRYKDIAFTPPNTNDEGTKMKKPTTLEIRILDTPSLFSFYEFQLRYIKTIAEHIKDDNPMVDIIDDSTSKAFNILKMSRALVVNQRYGVSKIFHKLNSTVCREVAERYGFNYHKDTQFEYREELGLSANINGYLSMATKGGWL